MSLIYKNKKFIDDRVGIEGCKNCFCQNLEKISIENFENLLKIKNSRHSSCLRRFIVYLLDKREISKVKKLLNFKNIPLCTCCNYNYYKNNYKEFFDIINKKKGLEIE